MPMFGVGPVPAGFLPEADFSVSGDFIHGSSITITGSGFGSKLQAAPVLWDFGDDVWVNGVENLTHAGKVDGDAVPVDGAGTPA